jgi:hypothetical protein
MLKARRAPYAVAIGRDQPIRILEDWGIVKRQARAAA